MFDPLVLGCVMKGLMKTAGAALLPGLPGPSNPPKRSAVAIDDGGDADADDADEKGLQGKCREYQTTTGGGEQRVPDDSVIL